MPDKTTKKYQAKIKQLAEELALELLQNEHNLESKLLTIDQEIQNILIDVGNKTIGYISKSLENAVKKKL